MGLSEDRPVIGCNYFRRSLAVFSFLPFLSLELRRKMFTCLFSSSSPFNRAPRSQTIPSFVLACILTSDMVKPSSPFWLYCLSSLRTSVRWHPSVPSFVPPFPDPHTCDYPPDAARLKSFSSSAFLPVTQALWTKAGRSAGAPMGEVQCLLLDGTSHSLSECFSPSITNA